MLIALIVCSFIIQYIVIVVIAIWIFSDIRIVLSISDQIRIYVCIERCRKGIGLPNVFTRILFFQFPVKRCISLVRDFGMHRLLFSPQPDGHISNGALVHEDNSIRGLVGYAIRCNRNRFVARINFISVARGIAGVNLMHGIVTFIDIRKCQSSIIVCRGPCNQVITFPQLEVGVCNRISIIRIILFQRNSNGPFAFQVVGHRLCEMRLILPRLVLHGEAGSLRISGHSVICGDSGLNKVVFAGRETRNNDLPTVLGLVFLRTVECAILIEFELGSIDLIVCAAVAFIALGQGQCNCGRGDQCFIGQIPGRHLLCL